MPLQQQALAAVMYTTIRSETRGICVKQDSVCNFVSMHLFLLHHALMNASTYPQAISVQAMTCAVCLEDGATYACECTAYFATCFSHVLMREGTQ